MNRMCQDCRELYAGRTVTTAHRGLVQSAAVIDLRTRKLQEGRHYVCLGCATRWEHGDEGWRLSPPPAA